MASRITPPNSAVYSGTKGAVDAITGVLSRELGPKKVRVSTLSPGPVETEGSHSSGFIGSESEKAAIAQARSAASANLATSPPSRLFLRRKTPPGLSASDFSLAVAFADPQATVANLVSGR